jgi:hypothetical protein
MRRSLVALVFGPYLYTASAIAGEVTSLQWDIIGDLEVFYAISAKTSRAEVHCTALNEENKPIGGGWNYAAGGVAKVRITVPRIYQNTDKVRVRCTP